MSEPTPAILCKNCPFRIESPKAGELGGSVPEHGPAAMRAVVRECTDGFKVMQCHKSSNAKPRPCAGFLSVVGYESIGVRFAVMTGIIRASDVGKKVRRLYGSLREMLRRADHMDIDTGEARP